MSSIGQITLAQAAKGTWTALWKGFLWVLAMMLACYVVQVEWNWRILVICVVSSFFDFVIYDRTRHSVGTPLAPEGGK